jgi:hypothetical protein
MPEIPDRHSFQVKEEARTGKEISTITIKHVR